MVEGAIIFLACAGAIFVFNALRTEDQSRLIKSHLQALGATDIEILHRLLSYDDKGNRIYEIEYTDQAGARVRGTCRTLGKRNARRRLATQQPGAAVSQGATAIG